MARSALIIGGSGQIGHATALALGHAGWDVSVASRGTRPLPPELSVRPVTLDREEPGALAAVADGYDLVVDTIAFTPDQAAELVALDVGRLAVISTAAVYLGSNGTYLDVADTPERFPDYPVPLDESWPTVENDLPTYSPLKAAMERTLLAGPLPVSILRAGAVHGPYGRLLREWYFVKRVLDGRRHAVLAWSGEGRFHPAATANVAALVVACADGSGHHVLNAVDDTCPTEAEIGAVVFDVMGHDAEIVTVPGPPQGPVGASPWGTPKPFVLSMDRARRELGYVAALSHREAVVADVEWALRALDGRSTQAWREVFGDLAGFGADQWFDYAAEDAFLSG